MKRRNKLNWRKEERKEEKGKLDMCLVK